jgi:hypothetical protein
VEADEASAASDQYPLSFEFRHDVHNKVYIPIWVSE